MKRALASVAGLVGIAALGRWLAQRRHATEPAPEPAADDPAEELRRKLADARGPRPATTPEPEPAPAPEAESLDERRARVHAKAREAIDAMSDDEAAS